MLVSIMASSTGKNTINTGTRIVPRPNPEKNVSKEAAKAVRGIIYSCMDYLWYLKESLN